MKSIQARRAGLTVLLALSLSGRTAVAAPLFSAASLRGSWGFQMVPAKGFTVNAPGDPGGVGSAVRQDILRVGVISFDGATSAVGEMIATTDDNAGNTVIITFGFSGSYTVNTDGTGTLSISPTVTDASCAPVTGTPALNPGDCANFEGPETYVLATTRNRGLSLTQTDNVGGGAKIFMKGEASLQSRSVFASAYTARSLRNTYSFTMGPAKSFAANPPLVCIANPSPPPTETVADPAGIAGAPRQDVLRVGQMSFNGAGGVNGHTIATTDDNAGNTVVIDFNWTGSYFINADGTGTLSITDPSPSMTDANCTPAAGTPPLNPGDCANFEGPETYAIAIVPKRGRVYLTETDNAGGGAKIFMAGEANYQ